ncbi:hypothetical protein [Rhizorhabdus wittichii]|uniref:hypothetical protein n=1 Tax=Rhizorhabdus wittichii TaxID=160791 RepID=UPI0012FE0E7E|nr:hypothetical protein [Rhizorhabdus wittichii]
MITSKSAAQLFYAMLRDQGKAAFTPFDLHLLVRILFRDRVYRGISIPHRNGPLTDSRARELISNIAESRSTFYPPANNRLLIQAPDFLSEFYLLDRELSAVDQLMLADPLCYLSHQSALQRHAVALTNDTAIHITTPRGTAWKRAAFTYMASQLTTIGAVEWTAGNFELTKARPSPVVAGQHVYRHETQYPIPSQLALIANCRVSPIGIAFRDTLMDPQWCGGIDHVIAVWRTHAKGHIEAIIPAIDNAPTQVAKVRAGYLLDELLGISDPRIDQWTAFAQRGSSRRLDPAAPFASTFSEKWMLSLNVALN